MDRKYERNGYRYVVTELKSKRAVWESLLDQPLRSLSREELEVYTKAVRMGANLYDSVRDAAVLDLFRLWIQEYDDFVLYEGSWMMSRSDNESNRHIQVFDRDVLTALGVRRDEHGDWAVDQTGWRQFYNGPGGAFGHEPYAQVGFSRVVVSQTTGLDI